jgi:hypothetical protein
MINLNKLFKLLQKLSYLLHFVSLKLLISWKLFDVFLIQCAMAPLQLLSGFKYNCFFFDGVPNVVDIL